MSIACKDMGVDCPYVVKGETMAELVKGAKEHAMKDHKAYWDETMSKMSDSEIEEGMKQYVKKE